MKLQLLLLAVFALPLVACGQSDTPEKPAATVATPNATVQTEKSNMNSANLDTYELKIKGMMCEHCQATVTKLLEGMDGVVSATVDHKAGTAIVKVKHSIGFNEQAAHDVIDKDYELVSCAEISPTN